ncbi:MAG: hypothetical protein D6689_18790 [Deltaproteobacteria bacterium]|nr:MAG: hypothetical protein D6689_18790 [Deltaproteobacteria bacterium]
MLGKAPGAVPCAHCATALARADCPVCRRAVCDRCAHDWATCSLPHGVELRLGLGRRLRAIDASGTFGVVTRWTRTYAWLDLRAARWLRGATGVQRPFAPVGACYPALLSDGRIVYPSFIAYGDSYRYDGLRVSALAGGPPQPLPSHAPPRWLEIDWTERFVWGPCEDETIDLVDLERGDGWTLRPVDRTVVQAAAVDGVRRVLATGVYGAVHLHRLGSDGDLERIDRLALPDSDVAWLGLSPRRLAVVAIRGSRSRLVVHALGDEGIRGPVYEDPPARRPGTSPIVRAYGGRQSIVAAMDPTGRFVAVVDRKRRDVHVHGVDTGTVQRLGEHTDRIHFVRFAAGGRQLVSADTDNRVLIRPLAGDAFVDATRRLPIAD